MTEDEKNCHAWKTETRTDKKKNSNKPWMDIIKNYTKSIHGVDVGPLKKEEGMTGEM